jgi:hypothetical protein
MSNDLPNRGVDLQWRQPRRLRRPTPNRGETLPCRAAKKSLVRLSLLKIGVKEDCLRAALRLLPRPDTGSAVNAYLEALRTKTGSYCFAGGVFAVGQNGLRQNSSHEDHYQVYTMVDASTTIPLQPSLPRECSVPCRGGVFIPFLQPQLRGLST